MLSYMTLALKENMPENVEIFSDLEGHKVNGRTISQDIIVTSSIPDLVTLDSSTHQKTVYLFELTVCFERADNIQSANQRKYNRYSSLTTDIQDRGYICKNIPF